MASSVIKVSVIGDVDKLRKAFSESATGAERWAGGMEKAGKRLTVGLTVPIVAGAALATKAAAEEAQEMEKLAGVISRQIPGATDEMIDANERWVTSLQNTIGVADGEIRGLEQKFIAAGASIEEAQMMSAAAFDTATATGKDYNSIADAMVKGMNGQTAGFSRLGIEVKKADGTMKSMDEILQDLAVHHGAAAEAADTDAGRAAIARAKMADLSETVGSMLLPVMAQLSDWLSKIADWFNNLDPSAQKIIVTLVGVAAAVGPVLIVASKLVTAFGIVGKAFTALQTLMMANPWLLLIAAVIALVVVIVTNWDTIVAFLKKTWAWITDTSKKVWEGLKAAVKSAVDFLVSLFMNWTLPGLIMKHWETIKKGAETVRDWIKGIWNGLIEWFKALPARVGSALSGLFDGLKNAFRNAINWVIDKWNGFKLSIKLPGLLGGGTIGIDTPNIPRFHQGGVFRSPTPGGEGLALLRDGERVLRPGQSGSQGSITNIYLEVNAGMGTDGITVGRQIVEALQRYSQVNGAVPITVRAS